MISHYSLCECFLIFLFNLTALDLLQGFLFKLWPGHFIKTGVLNSPSTLTIFKCALQIPPSLPFGISPIPCHFTLHSVPTLSYSSLLLPSTADLSCLLPPSADEAHLIWIFMKMQQLQLHSITVVQGSPTCGLSPTAGPWRIDHRAAWVAGRCSCVHPCTQPRSCKHHHKHCRRSQPHSRKQRMLICAHMRAHPHKPIPSFPPSPALSHQPQNVGELCYSR